MSWFDFVKPETHNGRKFAFGFYYIAQPELFVDNDLNHWSKIEQFRSRNNEINVKQSWLSISDQTVDNNNYVPNQKFPMLVYY